MRRKITKIVALVRDEDRFEAVIVPAAPRAPGTHELIYLWNRRPFISRVFQRGALNILLQSVRDVQDELMGRGWRLASPIIAGSPHPVVSTRSRARAPRAARAQPTR
jgi:hypothetical protein